MPRNRSPREPSGRRNERQAIEAVIRVATKGATLLGSNEQQHARAIVVFLFIYWEDEIRPRLARAKAVPLSQIRGDTLGDLRVLRNVILHARGILRPDKHAELKKLGGLFAVDQPLDLSYESMHAVFVALKQECARLLFDWLGVTDPAVKPEDIVDLKRAPRPA